MNAIEAILAAERDFFAKVARAAFLNPFGEKLDLLVAGILRRLTGTAPEREVQLLRKAIERETGKNYSWPGNVRELEQAVRRVLVTGHCRGEGMTHSVLFGVTMFFSGTIFTKRFRATAMIPTTASASSSWWEWSSSR